MSSKLIAGIVAAVVIVGAGAGYMLTKGDDKQSSQSTTQTTNTNAEQKVVSTNYSVSELAALGRAQKCSFTYSGSSGNSTAVMYTDGAGKSRIDMDNVSEQGNAGQITQIVRDGKSYTIITTAGQKMGFMFDVSQTQSSGSTSSNQGVDPNASFAMNCEAWTADAAQFEIPADVNFISTPSLTTQ
jgi:hypothetical protein